MKLIEKVKSVVSKIQEMKEKLIEEIRPNFFEIVKPVFDENENLKSISWTQFTPYFNDGDPCQFSTNFDYDLRLNKKDEYDSEEFDKEFF